METFVKDEQERLNWLKQKIDDSIDRWIHEKPPELEYINSNYVRKLVDRMINIENDYLHREPDDYIDIYGEELYGDEWKKLFDE